MKFVPTFLILLIFIIGCSENQNITSPIDKNSILKSSNPDDPSYMDTESAILLDVEPAWISLPTPSSLPQSTTFYTSKLILNDKTNNLKIDTSYAGGLHGSVSINMKLTFDAGVLPSDSLFVTAELDINNGTIKFGPATLFNGPVWVNYKITGLDFSGMDPNEIRFVYGCDDGSIEPVNCWYYEVDESRGSIQMWWGEIPHFSRYGFVRRSVDY